MIKANQKTFLLVVAAALALPLASPREALGQSGTTVGRQREKLKQAGVPQPAQPAPAAEAPVSVTGVPKSDSGGGMTVIAQDPNHISAVKALEQIRRDEESSSEGNGFTYDPGDRRDPFLSPTDVLQAQMAGQICQGEGMECWLIQDVTVIGVLKRKGGDVALVIGPDGYGTTLHEGDRLYDGEVRSIDSDTGLVMFRQRINDPTRIKPFRDVEKGLNLKEGRS